MVKNICFRVYIYDASGFWRVQQNITPLAKRTTLVVCCAVGLFCLFAKT
jgi:hypothetical protein